MRMANPFFVAQGHDVGNSRVEEEAIETAKKLINAHADKLGGNRWAQAAHTNQACFGITQFKLPVIPDVGQYNLARIRFQLLIVEFLRHFEFAAIRWIVKNSKTNGYLTILRK